MTETESPLRKQLNRLYNIRETAVTLRTQKRSVPGSLLLELFIILPDVIEDLIQLTQRAERKNANEESRKD